LLGLFLVLVGLSLMFLVGRGGISFTIFFLMVVLGLKLLRLVVLALLIVLVLFLCLVLGLWFRVVFPVILP